MNAGCAERGVSNHVVHFYERGPELIDAVAGEIGGAVARGDAAVIVATREHAIQLEAAIQDAGIDRGRARREGRLVIVDAVETLGRFVRDGRPDSAAFSEVMGALIGSASASAPSVRVFGEMVAVLWEQGLVAAAIVLEDLWNDLALGRTFSLLCAYPAELVGDDDLEPLLRICDRHTAIVGAARDVDEAARRFECSVLAPRAARHFVTATLRGWGFGDLADEAALVVTELATNAVHHARAGFDARIVHSRHRVRVELTDTSRVAPTLCVAGGEASSGRGLVLVGALSLRWGHELLERGKRVWVELGA